MRARCALAVLAVSLVSCGDNHHPGGGTLLLSPQTGLFTDEAGTTATFTVALTHAPEVDVVVRLTSSDAEEGTVSPRQLVFTKASYARAQTVTITGVDDRRADGDLPYAVRVGTDLLGSYDIDVVNGDDDTAGVRATPLLGLMTSESGTQATFEVELTSEPTGIVVVPLSSSDATEGSIGASQVTFTPQSWNQPQTITIEGEQDTTTDGSVPFSIVLGVASSIDPSYDGLDPDDVQVLNVDDDVFGIAVTPTTGLVTAESGTQATFGVVLQTQPAGNVTIGVSSSDTSEATTPTTQLVFTPATWNVAQTVTVTGANDNVDDDDQPFTIVLATATSADANYAGKDPADVTGSNTDNDTADVVVAATQPLLTTEAGGSDVFTVVLSSQPTASLTIAVSSSDPTEGVPQQTLLTFTTANWMTAQNVTVTGVNDTATDGDIGYTIQLANPVTTDVKYAAINPADVSATNEDNDVPGFTFEPASGLEVSEFGDTDQFSVVLNTPPTANVTIGFTSSDMTEGTVLPASITFTPANWNVPVFVTVTGINDTSADGNIAYSVLTSAATSADAAYSGLNPPDVDVITFDNDTAQVFVKSRRRISVSENGGSSTFRVRLTVAPTATVTCTLMSSDPTEGTASPTTLTFQPNNFGFRTVTVTGVDDALVDGDIAFSIVLNACTSTDLAYQGVNPRDVGVLNRDND